MKRASGVLLPVFSLPSKYGIGCFSKEAYKFVDHVKRGGTELLADSAAWDRLAMEIPHTSLSPHMLEIHILLIWKTLIKEGLLTKKECKVYDFGDSAGSIDYEKIYNSRFKVLKKAL